MIKLSKVHKSYGQVSVLHDVDWDVNRGEFWGVIGPNGSGKSTLLSLISGVEVADSGDIRIETQSVTSYGRKDLSRKMAVLQQDGLPIIHYSVREVIEMGRFPFQDWMGRDKLQEPERLIDDILDKLDLSEMSERPLNELSGGQRQRVALGKVMAQQPSILLLDEPTTYLDIRYQLQFMDLISEWRQREDLTIVAVMHDLNLAAQYCDKLIVLDKGGVKAAGAPLDIVTTEMLETVFGVRAVILPHPDSGVPQLLLRSDLQTVR